MVRCLLYALTFGVCLAGGFFVERNLNLDLVRRVVVGYCPVSSLRWSLVFDLDLVRRVVSRLLPSVFSALVPRFHFWVLKILLAIQVSIRGCSLHLWWVTALSEFEIGPNLLATTFKDDFSFWPIELVWVRNQTKPVGQLEDESPVHLRSASQVGSKLCNALGPVRLCHTTQINSLSLFCLTFFFITDIQV